MYNFFTNNRTYFYISYMIGEGGYIIRFNILLIVFILMFACCSSCIAFDQQSKIKYKVSEIILEDGLLSTKPEEQGMDSEKLKEMDDYINDKLPHIQSVLVLRNGKVVFEKYYQGYSENDLFRVCSVTKTITSALIGIALKNKYIKSIDQKVIDFFKEYNTSDIDPKTRKITRYCRYVYCSINRTEYGQKVNKINF